MKSVKKPTIEVIEIAARNWATLDHDGYVTVFFQRQMPDGPIKQRAFNNPTPSSLVRVVRAMFVLAEVTKYDSIDVCKWRQ